ncbi:hypothetical protein DFJ73DRAFT_17253 [Zopfochytrium polystomum]|nr:hypothetical protein DFJ73DRAFT_17253 [Zopfochytrium polystomum]
MLAPTASATATAAADDDREATAAGRIVDCAGSADAADAGGGGGGGGECNDSTATTQSRSSGNDGGSLCDGGAKRDKPAAHFDDDDDDDDEVPAVPPPRADFTAEQRASLAEVARRVEESEAALEEGDREAAVCLLAIASETLASLYGADAVECAEVLFLYGKALLEFAVFSKEATCDLVHVPCSDDDSGIESIKVVPVFDEAGLGEDCREATGSPTNDDEGSDAEAGDAGSCTDGGDGQSSESDGGSADEEELSQDLQISCEVLNLSKSLFERMPGEHAVDRIGDIYFLLGEVAFEAGDWDSALEEYRRALDAKIPRLPKDHRDIAALQFRAALALEMSGEPERALERYQRTRELLARRLERLRRTAQPANAAELGEFHDAREEVADIESLIPDLEEKICRLERRIDEDRKMIQKALSAAASGGSASDSGTAGVQQRPRDVDDDRCQDRDEPRGRRRRSRDRIRAPSSSPLPTNGKRKAAADDEGCGNGSPGAPAEGVRNEESGLDGASAKRTRLDDNAGALCVGGTA